MKTVFMILSLSFCFPLFPQDGSITGCRLTYSDKIESYVYQDPSMACKEILIDELPPLSQPFARIYLGALTKGQYSFKKAGSLKLPEDYNIYIEDSLTGELFDLKANQAFSFNVVRSISDRFAIYIKPIVKLTAQKSKAN